MILPLVFIFTGYEWTLANLDQTPQWAQIITQTGSSYFVILTSAVLALILYFFYRKNIKLLTAIIIYSIFALAATQGIKTALKPFVAEPRPYVAQMAQSLANNNDKSFFTDLQTTYSFEHPDVEEEVFLCKSACTREDIEDLFYSLKKQQKIFFTQYFANRYYSAEGQEAKKAQLEKLADETGYSLPSGHSMFAATWMCIFLLIAFNARSVAFWLVSIGVLIWGNFLEASRMLLGVHYAHDVLFSDIIAAIFIWLTFWIIFYTYKLMGGQVGRKKKPTPQAPVDPDNAVPADTAPTTIPTGIANAQAKVASATQAPQAARTQVENTPFTNTPHSNPYSSQGINNSLSGSVNNRFDPEANNLENRFTASQLEENIPANGPPSHLQPQRKNSPFVNANVNHNLGGLSANNPSLEDDDLANLAAKPLK